MHLNFLLKKGEVVMKVSFRKLFFLVAISLIFGLSYASSVAFAEEENAVAAKEDTTAAKENAGVEEENTTDISNVDTAGPEIEEGENTTAVSGVDTTEPETEAENTTAASGVDTTELETEEVSFTDMIVVLQPTVDAGRQQGSINIDGDAFFGGNIGVGTMNPNQGLHVVVNNENTSSIERIATFHHMTTGTARDGIGASIGIGAEIDTGGVEEGRIQYSFPDMSNNSIDGLMEFQTHDDNSLGTRLAINGSNVGIGTENPTYKLHINGTSAGTSWINFSSRDYKVNIKKVKESKHYEMLSKLMKLTLTTYNDKKEYGGDDTTRLGFIAEEMPEEVLSKDGKGVDVYGLITFTIGAMKAQQKMIQKQQETIAALTREIKMLKTPR